MSSSHTTTQYNFLQGSICTELIQRLCEYRPHLNRAVAVAAEVDCLMSLAQAAREHHYTRPLLTKDNVLHIKQGIHIQHMCVVQHTSVPAACPVRAISQTGAGATCHVQGVEFEDTQSWHMVLQGTSACSKHVRGTYYILLQLKTAESTLDH